MEFSVPSLHFPSLSFPSFFLPTPSFSPFPSPPFPSLLTPPFLPFPPTLPLPFFSPSFPLLFSSFPPLPLPRCTGPGSTCAYSPAAPSPARWGCRDFRHAPLLPWWTGPVLPTGTRYIYIYSDYLPWLFGWFTHRNTLNTSQWTKVLIKFY